MILIGEKLNGSIPAVGKAIAERNEKRIRSLARRQEAAGADFLDVCASVEESVEVETLKWMLDIIQSASSLPISLDSPSQRTLVEALKYCDKPGIINSVSGEGDKMDVVFPVIADTKWGCVALLCDDRGIPKSVDQRMETFEAIMAKAKSFGITPDRLYIDPLVVTLSTDETALTKFAECTRRIKSLYPEIHITSGLSNISFGLPARKLINQAFMTLAMSAGMDSAIVDPTNRDMLGTIYAAGCILEQDEYCLEYINAFREGRIGPEKEKEKEKEAAGTGK